MHFNGLMIWLIGCLLHLMFVSDPLIQFKLGLYLLVCALEVYVVKYFTISSDTITKIPDLKKRFDVDLLFFFLPTGNEIHDRIQLWS